MDGSNKIGDLKRGDYLAAVAALLLAAVGRPRRKARVAPVNQSKAEIRQL
jgi:hypothetical protein